jgi:hypothetical protein
LNAVYIIDAVAAVICVTGLVCTALLSKMREIRSGNEKDFSVGPWQAENVWTVLQKRIAQLREIRLESTTNWV